MKLERGQSIEIHDDRRFGEAGLASHYHDPEWVGPESRHGTAYQVVADPRGDGFVCVGTSRPRGQRVWALAFLRFSRDGQLLDDMGVLPPGGSPDLVRAAVTDYEGAIVTAGSNRDRTSFLVRVFPEQEAIDASYGANFRAWLEQVDGRRQTVQVLALLPAGQGKMLVAGSVYRREGLKTLGPFVVRLNVDGTVDHTFRKYGGPPAADSQYQMLFHALGRQRDGTIVAAGKVFELDSGAVAAVINLDEDGTPIRSGASREWSSWLNSVTCIAPDVLTGGLVLGGFRQPFEEVTQACVARMLPDGRIDTSASGGGLWKTATRDSAVYAVATTRSGSIVAVGQDRQMPAMFVVNPDGTTPPGLGSVGMTHLAETGIAIGLCVSGSRVVVPLLSVDEGFLLAGYQLKAVAPATAVRRPLRTLSRALAAAEQQPSAAASGSAARSRFLDAARKAEQKEAAVAAGKAWLAKSGQNTANSARMMAIHAINMSRW